MTKTTNRKPPRSTQSKQAKEITQEEIKLILSSIIKNENANERNRLTAIDLLSKLNGEYEKVKKDITSNMREDIVYYSEDITSN